MPKTRRRFTSEFKSEAVRLDRAYERNGDTGGEFGGRYAATVMAGLRAAKWERRVGALACPAHHSPSRTRLMATAVATCCRWVLARPR